MPQVLTNLDLCQNELQNARIQNLTSPPADPVEGQEYYDTTLKAHRVFNGESWTTPGEGSVKSVGATAPVQSSGGADPVISVDIGTKADTVAAGDDSRFPTSDQKAALAGVGGTPSGSNKYVTDKDDRLTDARAPTTHKSTHAAGGSDALSPADIGAEPELGFTPEDSAKKGKASGYASLDANKKIPLDQLPDLAKSQTYVVADAGERQALAGMLAGDKVYETGTGDSYIWDGSKWLLLAAAEWENVNLQWGSIMDSPESSVSDIDDAVDKRHSHSNKSALDGITDAGSGKVITATERTKLSGIAAGANKYTHPTDGGGSRSGLTGATVISGITVNEAGHVTATAIRDLKASDIGATQKYAVNVGGSTSQVVTHGLGTRDVAVTVRENASPYAQVWCDVEMTGEDTVTLRFATAPAANALRVTVVG